MKKTFRTHRPRGFTLIEVMLSVVILAIGLSVVLKSFLQCLNAIEASRDYMIAASAAKARIDTVIEAAFTGNTTLLNVTGGSQILANRKFSWAMTMTDLPQPDNTTMVFLTDAAVIYTWKEGVRQSSLPCHAYVVFPQVKTPEPGK